MSRKRNNRWSRSFHAAACGIAAAVGQERNLRFHLVAAAGVCYLRAYFPLSKGQDAALILTVALVLALELINTAIERAVDLCCDQYHPLAKAAKDIAAGAVLVGAVAAIFVGLRLFWDPALLWQIVQLHLASPIRLVLVALAAALAIWFVAGFSKDRPS